MSDIVIKAENISKQYRLGKVGRKSLHDDLNKWWHSLLGKPDPYKKFDNINNSTSSNKNYMWALRDINFEVQNGEVLGIIGRNGAGKSTLLKILSKVTAPTYGTVKIKGRIASLLEVGTGFHPELTGRDNVFLNGAILGMTRKEIAKKFDAIVDFSGVERYIDTPVKRFSSGMHVRLAFAVAAHLEPDILIVDEVLAVGDIDFQNKCLGKIKEVSEKRGRTVLFVSHSIPSILKLCHSAIVLDMGKAVFSGICHDAVDFYLKNKIQFFTQKVKERKDRRGKGFAMITNIDILDNNMEMLITPKSGDDINIRFIYEVYDKVVQHIVFRFTILNDTEEVFFTCTTETSTENYIVTAEKEAITCFLPSLPLFGGKYYIHAEMRSKEIGLLDGIDYAKEFTVIDGDFFGNGKLPNKRNGVLIANIWKKEKIVLTN